MFARARCAAFSICDAELRPWGVGFFPLGGAVNHSCVPNCVALFSPGRGGGGGGGSGVQQAFRTVAPVAAGEQLTISYVDVGLPTHLRRAALRESYFFECACPACVHYVEEAGAPRERGGRLLVGVGGGVRGAGGVDGDSDGDGGAPPPRWKFADALSPRDEKLLSLRCGGDGGRCGGALVALLPPPRGGAPADFAACAFALPCARCGAALQPERARALRELYASAAAASGCGDGGGGEGGLSRARAALALALRVLAPTHHLLGTLAAAAAHAEVGAGEWERAAAANAAALPALRAGYPAGHPLPGLHLAMAGKLAHYADAPREAAVHLRAAVEALALALGGDHEVCRDLAARLHAAETEAEAGDAGDGEAAGKPRGGLARLLP
jgi:hypothetical protein